MFTLERSVALAPLTTLHVGGAAEALVRVREAEQLKALPGLLSRSGLPWFILGGGSNVYFADGSVSRLIIKNELRGVTFTTVRPGVVRVEAAAGEDWDALVDATAQRGLSGFENLSGIPGTVGAAPIQNINAYGAAVADTIVSVDAVHVESGTPRTFSAAECAFGYRDSIFKHPDGAAYLVTRVCFELAADAHPNLTYRSASQSLAHTLADTVPNGQPSVADIRDAVLTVRRNIGMVAGIFNSAGSFFKNTIVSREQFERIHAIVASEFPEQNESLAPWHWELPDGSVKISTAFLMECTPYNKHAYAAGVESPGTVALSPLHTLSIINRGGASATDVRVFASQISDAVAHIFGVELEPEVTYVA